MTKVRCKLSMCKHNSSCCVDPYKEEGYCTKDYIEIIFDEEMCTMDCKEYAMSTSKASECVKCQIKKYGSVNIGLQTPIFEVEESDDVPY